MGPAGPVGGIGSLAVVASPAWRAAVTVTAAGAMRLTFPADVIISVSSIHIATSQRKLCGGGKAMVRCVPRPAHLAEELPDLAGHDAVVLEPPQQVILRFFRRRVQSGMGCGELCEELGVCNI